MCRSWIPTPPSPCPRFTESLAVAAQDSGPSRSLVFTRKALSSSTSCRFIPAHKNGDFTHPPGVHAWVRQSTTFHWLGFSPTTFNLIVCGCTVVHKVLPYS